MQGKEVYILVVILHRLLERVIMDCCIVNVTRPTKTRIKSSYFLKFQRLVCNLAMAIEFLAHNYHFA